MKSKSGKKSRFLYPACQNRALVARKTGFCSLQSAEKSSFWQETPIPVGFQESGKGFALQKCRFLATRAPGGSSGYRNADFLPSAEARTLSWTTCAAPKSATLPLLSRRFLMGQRKGERPVPSPLASHRPERQHGGKSAPSPRLRRPFTPPMPSATPTPSPCLYLPPCPPFASGRATGVHQAIFRLR